jgi:hypothetical protein
LAFDMLNPRRAPRKRSVDIARLASISVLTMASLVAVQGSAANADALSRTLGVSTSELNFGPTTLGTVGNLELTLTNNGTSTDTINVTSATFSEPGPGDYLATASPGCPGNGVTTIILGAGASCPVNVSFYPPNLGPFPATMTLQGSADSTGVTVDLMGEGSIGYYQVDSRGAVMTAGDAAYFGDARNLNLEQPIVAITPTGDNGGYWLAAADGGVFSYGDARFFGSAAGLALNRPIVGMAGGAAGYWLVSSDGGVFTYGDALFYGSAANLRLNQPIVGMASDGDGYWLVASDGGVFAYGDAHFYGSAGNLHLNQPIVGMAATPDGRGYWLVSSDGGVFSYGDAGFHGSAGAMPLAQPVVAIAPMPTGCGYWINAADGGLFNYGDAPFYGSAVGTGLERVVDIATDGDPVLVRPLGTLTVC